MLIVDDDPAVLTWSPSCCAPIQSPFEPVTVESAEAALRRLEGGEDFDCLLADVLLPGMDGLQLMMSARELRPALKIVVMTSAPSDNLRQAVLDCGATRLLSKPLDFEDLLVSVAADRPGTISHLEGDLDLMDICRLSAAIQGEGGARFWREGWEGILAHRGATLVHAHASGPEAGAEAAGPDAFESLRGRGPWRFESLPALSVARARGRTASWTCRRPVARLEGDRASGSLRGLSMRHLIEWAMAGRLTCTLRVTSERRTGRLAFDGGKIRDAETGDREGGRAAAEILDWRNLRVELIRPAVEGESFPALIDRFRGEIEGFLATCVVAAAGRRHDRTRSADPRLDAAAAACLYARVIDSHLAAVEALGAGEGWGRTEDILISTRRGLPADPPARQRPLSLARRHERRQSGPLPADHARFESLLLAGLADSGA